MNVARSWIGVGMSDLIDRQQAIKALDFEIVHMTAYCNGKNEGNPLAQYNKGLEDGIKAIEVLPSAEPERKMGHWVKVGGYFTPGGDPVWKCSECGKGIHVYGIEANSYNRDYTDGHQWVACPNCGADMKGE